MKSCILEQLEKEKNVAPFAGAWIEIMLDDGKPVKMIVAPFAGAWIEISEQTNRLFWETVAPFAGAWIEIITR